MTRKLHIGFDAKRLFHNNTGLGNYSRNLVLHLAKYFPEHTYHLFTPSIQSKIDVKPFVEGNFVIHICPPLWPKGLWRSYGVSQRVNELKLDIFHGLSHELPFGIGPTTKKVVTIHDLIYETLPHTFPVIDRKLYQWKYRSSAKRADKIVAISQYTKHDLEKLYHINKDKIAVVYQSCNEVFQQYQAVEKKPYLLYVGTVSERKNLLQVAEAYLQLKPTERMKLVVIGDGGSYKTKVESFIGENNLTDWFVFLGNLPNESLLQHYREATALVFPSIYEGFGIPIIEAMFSKTMVVSSNQSSMPEAAGPHALYFDPNDADSLVVALRKLNDIPSLTPSIEQNHRYVQQHFGAEVTAQHLMQVYRDLLS